MSGLGCHCGGCTTCLGDQGWTPEDFEESESEEENVGLSVEMRDLLPVMDDADLELRIRSSLGKWWVRVRHLLSGDNLYDAKSDELWQGLDAALSWIWSRYGEPASPEREARQAEQDAYDMHADAALGKR